MRKQELKYHLLERCRYGGQSCRLWPKTGLSQTWATRKLYAHSGDSSQQRGPQTLGRTQPDTPLVYLLSAFH
jgi:hypothetical protein